MNYTKAVSVDVDSIPQIDIAAIHDDSSESLLQIHRQMLQAAENTGFFYIRNHGIAADLIDRVFGISRIFFSRPATTKAQAAVNEFHRGHLSIGNARMENSQRVDLKESFIWGREADNDEAENRLVGPNRWPDDIPDMESVLQEYLDGCNRLGQQLLRAFSAGLECDTDHFVCHFDRPISRGALVWYPPQPELSDSEQFGVAPHTDYGCLTLLYQDNVGGLQVKARSGEWVAAHPIEGCFVVNVGDLLQRWTNDRFASTEHRVVNQSGRERYSVAVFVDPNFDTPIDPVLQAGDKTDYATVSCGEYVLGRFDRSFAYRQS